MYRRLHLWRTILLKYLMARLRDSINNHKAPIIIRSAFLPEVNFENTSTLRLVHASSSGSHQSCPTPVQSGVWTAATSALVIATSSSIQFKPTSVRLGTSLLWFASLFKLILTTSSCPHFRTRTGHPSPCPVSSRHCLSLGFSFISPG